MDTKPQHKLETFLLGIRAGALKYAALRCGDEDTALDLLQDTMMGFAGSAENFPPEAWKSLFYKILQRRIADHFRKRQWRSRLAQMFSLSARDSDDEPVYEPADCEHAGHHFEAGELQQAFEAALQALPERQQQAYLLRQWQQMSVKQVADIMQCSQGSVKTHLSRAMTNLRQALGEWINDDEQD